MRIGGMTARRIERLAERGVTNLDEFANADNADLRRAIPGTKAKDLEAMKEHARELAAEEGA
jgi:hypothetical protein